MNIKQYQKIKTINNFAFDDELTKKLKVLSELSKISLEKLEELPLAELQKVSDKYKLSLDYNSNNKKTKFKLKLNKTKYTFKWKLTELTASQFITINYYIAQSNGDVEMQLHNILAPLAFPTNFFGKTNKYDSTLHKKISEDILNYMNIEDAFNILSFFLQFLQELDKAILSCLNQKVQKTIKTLKKK